LSVHISAPGKLLLLGDHAVVYGHPCIVTAINKRIEVSIEKAQAMHISTPGNGSHEFIHEAIQTASSLWDLPKNFFLAVYSPFSGKYGFGSSSAVTVATLKALAEFANVSVTNRELFEHALRVVLKIQGVGSGFDVAAACFGNTIFYKNKGEILDAIPHRPYNLIVGYTGTKANTVEIVKEVIRKREKYPEEIDKLFHAIGELVVEAKQYMIEGDYKTLGALMDANQEYLRDLGVSSQTLERLISAAKQAGAWGAKLSGAGKGDCMIAIVSDEKKQAVRMAIEAAGGEVVDVLPDEQGVAVTTKGSPVNDREFL